MFLKNERRAAGQGRAKTIDMPFRGGGRGTPGAARRERRAAWLGVGLLAAAYVLRNRRFYEMLGVGVIVLTALTQMGWKVLVRVVRDLIAWDDARLADLERQLRRQSPARAADDAVLEGTVIAARQPEASSRTRAAVWLGVALVAAGRVLRNRRFDEQVIVFLLALAALSQIGRKELALAVKDLIAWDNARLADLEKQLRRQREAEAVPLENTVR